jgi:hypothetical protein
VDIYNQLGAWMEQTGGRMGESLCPLQKENFFCFSDFGIWDLYQQLPGLSGIEPQSKNYAFDIFYF